jgi:hypothetical protein
MIVRNYEPSDFETVKGWAQAGYDTEYTAEQFPKTGFIVPDIAALFLYSTDSTVCFLENMISNREADKEEKSKALDLLISKAFSAAKEKGFSVAYATTGNLSVIVRAMKHGAHMETKQVLLTKNLSPS